MSISKQKGGTYAAAFMAKGTRYYAAGFITSNLALIWEMNAKEQIKQGFEVTYPKTSVSSSKPPENTLSHWLDKTYRMFWADAAGPEKARHKMKEINAYFGSKLDVNDLTTAMVDDFILNLKHKNNAGSTINRKLATISKMLNYTDECINLRHKPKIHRQREPSGRTRYVTPEEEVQIMQTLDQFQQFDLKDSITVLLDTGMRRSELGSIEPVDVSGGLIHLWRTKNGVPRSIPMTKRVTEVMKRRTVTITGTKIFPKTPETLSDNWNSIRFHLGFDDMPLHTFRHTTASRLTQRGVGVAAVQAWMGHKTIAVTMRYSHLSPKNLLDALDVLES